MAAMADRDDRLEIRELVENWAVWRDAGDWQRFRSASAQTKMTISQRAAVEGVDCDVVCTGRFYDVLERRAGARGLSYPLTRPPPGPGGPRPPSRSTRRIGSTRSTRPRPCSWTLRCSGASR